MPLTIPKNCNSYQISEAYLEIGVADFFCSAKCTMFPSPMNPTEPDSAEFDANLKHSLQQLKVLAVDTRVIRTKFTGSLFCISQSS